MSKSAKESIKEKLAGIYKANKFSPLFTRAAEIEFDKGNLNNAIDILKNGLKIFPEYSTAYILLGKTYLEMKNFENAEECFRKGCSPLNLKESFNFYITEIEKSKRHELLKPGSEQPAYKPTEKPLPETEEFSVISDFNNNDLADEDELDELVKKIDNAKINLSEDDNEPIVIQPEEHKKETVIVSETLAKIYISQGKFKEALEIYKKLLLKEPDKKEYLQHRIKEIESQISGMNW